MTTFHFQSESNPRTNFRWWEFYNSFGETIRTNNLRHFSNEYGLCHKGLSDMVCGRLRTYRGMRFKDCGYAPFIMKSPNGEIHKVEKTIPEFSKEHGLNANYMYHILRGAAKSTKKWTVECIPSKEELEAYVRITR